MPVPSSPHFYRRVIGPKDCDESLGSTFPPTRKYSSTCEAFLSTPSTATAADSGGDAARKLSVTGSGCHRSRERTRQSAVQRLVERKLAQKEKEKEKERDRSWTGGHVSESFLGRSRSREARDRSETRSENGFMLGGAFKENIRSSRQQRNSRSCSGSRNRDLADLTTTKTYITIGPGKPTRIREHSPAKSAKLSSDETVTSARQRSAAQCRRCSPLKAVDLNIHTSPSPQRKLSAVTVEARNIYREKDKEYLRPSSPLRSTDILKSFQSTNSQATFERSRKISFLSEKLIYLSEVKTEKKTNQRNAKSERRLSIEVLEARFHDSNTNDQLHTASVDSENSSSNRSSLSSLSGSSDIGTHGDKSPTISQRRISLEQRFHARTRISSPERTIIRNNAAKTKILESTNFVNQVLYCSATSNGQRSSLINPARPVPASRKISLPQPPLRRPEPAPRRKTSLQTIASVDR